MNFEISETMEGFKIVYTKYPSKLCEFYPSGFGVTKETRIIANKILGFLNSLPDEEIIPYPYNHPNS